MGIPLKFTTTFNRRRMKRGNLALGLGRQDYTTIGGYSNMPPPEEDKKVIYQRTGASNPPLCWSVELDDDVYRVIKTLGYSGANDISAMLSWIAQQNNIMILTNQSTITNTVLPFAVYQALGNNPALNDAWYSMLDPSSGDSIEHGLSEWICMESKTIDYAAPYSNTKIYEIDTDNSVSLKGNVGSNPGRGSLVATAGKRYVADKPISLTATGNQNAIAPLTYQGQNWGYYYTRYDPPNLYVYGMEDNTDVFITVGDDLLTSFSVDDNEVYTYTFPSGNANKFINISSTSPIVCTARGTSGDKGVLPLAGEYNYRRSNEYERTIVNTAPSVAGQTNVVYDSTYKSWAISIADGSGGDSEQSVPLEMLSKNYAYGDFLRSFYLVSPYDGNNIVVSSWNGSAWTTRNSYTLNGTLTSPVTAESGSQAGSGDRFNSDQMWKFEGSEPFYIVINDDSRDEEVLLGWNSAKVNCLFT